jgi:hypothetical protein
MAEEAIIVTGDTVVIAVDPSGFLSDEDDVIVVQQDSPSAAEVKQIEYTQETGLNETSVVAVSTGPPGKSVNVQVSTTPPTPSDPGADGDLWAVINP